MRPLAVQNSKYGRKTSLILNRNAMGILGTEDFHFFICTILKIVFIHISTFTFVQYVLLIHIILLLVLSHLFSIY